MKERQELKKEQVNQVTNFYPPPVVKVVTHWVIKVYSANQEPERWRRHRQAADRSYANWGLEVVGRDHKAANKKSPLFFSEATLDGIPIGGVCMHLPSSLGSLPIQDELEGYVDSLHLERFIQELIPEGIVHGGGLWIDPSQRGTGLAGDLSRSFMPMIVAAKAKYYVATAHQHALNAWCSLGCEPVSLFPTFPYPDQRYQTSVLLGDIGRSPHDLVVWASEQVNGAALDGQGARFSIRPMRAAALQSEIA